MRRRQPRTLILYSTHRSWGLAECTGLFKTQKPKPHQPDHQLTQGDPEQHGFSLNGCGFRVQGSNGQDLVWVLGSLCGGRAYEL